MINKCVITGEEAYSLGLNKYHFGRFQYLKRKLGITLSQYINNEYTLPPSKHKKKATDKQILAVMNKPLTMGERAKQLGLSRQGLYERLKRIKEST